MEGFCKGFEQGFETGLSIELNLCRECRHNQQIDEVNKKEQDRDVIGG